MSYLLNTCLCLAPSSRVNIYPVLTCLDTKITLVVTFRFAFILNLHKVEDINNVLYKEIQVGVTRERCKFMRHSLSLVKTD